MTVTVQNLRSFASGSEPTSLLPAQLCFNLVDRIVYVGDGSSDKTDFAGNTVPGAVGGGWFSMPMDLANLETFFLANPEVYGDIPTDGQVVTWSSTLDHPIWASGGSGGGSQVYLTTNGAVALAPGATTSDKISAAIGVVSPDEGDAVIVSGVSGEIYQGLYLFQTAWYRAAYFAYPNAASVPYSNTVSGLSAVTVQQGIDELDVLTTIATSTANTAVANANAATVIAQAALPKAGGTMTGSITFVGGQIFPVSGIQDSTSAQKGVVQGGSNMIYSSAGVIDVRLSSVTQTGVVQLVNSTSNTSQTLAPTAAAVADLQTQINGLTVASNVNLAGTLNASTGLVDSVTSDGTSVGFVSGAPLPAAAGRTDYYVIVSTSGSYNPPGGGGPYAAESGDWFLSNGTIWQFLGVGARPTYATTTTAGIIQIADNATTQAGSSAILAVTPTGLQSKVSNSVVTTSSNLIASSTAVKTAFDRGATAETNSIPKITVAAKGTIVTGSAANTPAGLPVGLNGYILAANSTTATGLEWVADSPNDVTSVSGTVPIVVNNTNPQTPVIGVSLATSATSGVVQVGSNIDVAAGVVSVKSSSTTQAGVVQLEDSVTSTSTLLALTANQGYNLQQQINALAISNNITLAGTIDGSTGFMVTVTTEGAAKGFTIGAALPAPVAGNSEYFAIVTIPGTMTPPGGSAQAVNDGDWWLSNGTIWQYLNIGYSNAYATTVSPGVVQLATNAEVQAGVETTHAIVPSALQSKLSDSISTTSSTTIASSTAVKTVAQSALYLPLATASTIYVNGTNGSDATGTRGTNLPFQTINAALAAAGDDDTIIIGPAIYAENVTITKSVNIYGTFNDQAIDAGPTILGQTILALTTASHGAALSNLFFKAASTGTNAFTVNNNSFTIGGNTTIQNCTFASASGAPFSDFCFVTSGTWTRSLYLREVSFQGNIKMAAGTATGTGAYMVIDNYLGTGDTASYIKAESGLLEIRNTSQGLAPIKHTGGTVYLNEINGWGASAAALNTVFGTAGWSYQGTSTGLGNAFLTITGGSNIVADGTTFGAVSIGANVIYTLENVSWDTTKVTNAGTPVTAVAPNPNVINLTQARFSYETLKTTSTVTAANQLATVLDATTGTMYSVAAFDSGTY